MGKHNKISRQKKIVHLAQLYRALIWLWDANGKSEQWAVFNACIIDSVGITGLEEVKKLAWKDSED